MQKFKRKLKGVEPIVAAVILIAIAVAGGLILYLVLTGAIGSTPVPKLQLDVYNSKIMGTTAYVVVNAGEDVTSISSATISQGNAPFRAGSVITFVCENIPASSKYVFEMVYTSGATRKVFRADWIRS
ncbi:MAG: hypothetical protein QXN04_09975 [Pyrobaculum sp.]